MIMTGNSDHFPTAVVAKISLLLVSLTRRPNGMIADRMIVLLLEYVCVPTHVIV